MPIKMARRRKTYVINRKHPCARCRHPEFLLGKAGDGRPDFMCTNCDHSWTCGSVGGDYLKYGRLVKR